MALPGSGVDLVAVSSAQSCDGRVVDLTALAMAAHTAGVKTLIDVSQSAGWLPVHARDFDIEVLRLETEQPVADPAAHQSRPADTPHGVQQGAQVGGQVHVDYFSLVTAATTRQSQPASRAIPPSGVTGPAQRYPPNAIA